MVLNARRRVLTGMWSLAAGAWLPISAGAQNEPAKPVVVASKPFGESFLLGEMFSQLLEARGFEVERRLGLGATEIAFQALRTGAIDVYPEYTGTGLVAILGKEPDGDPRQVFRTVTEAFDTRFGVKWLPPLGFQNTYAITVRRETADAYQLRTLSDLAREATHLIGGFSPDFIGRSDGLAGLRTAYGGLGFRETRSLLQAVKYQALAEAGVDVIDGYSTDGAIARYGLVILEDDLGFFPAYEAAALVGERLWTEQPRAIAVLTELSGKIDESGMRALNQRLEVAKEPREQVAASLLESLGLVERDPKRVEAITPGDAEPFILYLYRRRGELMRLTLRHVVLVTVALAGAATVAIPGGLLLERLAGAAETGIRAVGLLQTIPSIALLAFMIPLLGIGIVPALVALFLYSLYPILRNTYSGIRDASPEAVNAAQALGMTPAQVLRYVRLPLAAPIIMAGVRTAAVITVGTATLAAFIGAGGLGDPIVAGLALTDTRMILSGAIPAAMLALLVDAALATVESLLRPGGFGGKESR